MTAGVRVLGGVGEEVGEHLGEPHRVPRDGDGLAPACRPSARAARLRATGRLVSMAERTMKREIERLALHVDHAARDARHFEQIVDQPNEVADLALHDWRSPERRRDPAGPSALSSCSPVSSGASGLRSS